MRIFGRRAIGIRVEIKAKANGYWFFFEAFSVLYTLPVDMYCAARQLTVCVRGNEKSSTR